MLPEFPEAAAIKVLQGKESVAVDLANDEGRQVAYDIIARADAVLQSYRAGAAERLGVDPDSLMQLNPNLVYLTSPGYGPGGPCGHRPAYAPTIAAGAGMGWRNAAGTIPEDPGMSIEDMKVNSMRLRAASSGFGHPDGFASLGVATALLLGLVARKRGAGGQTMNTSMLSTTAHALADDMIEYPGRRPAASAAPDFYGLNALYRLYEAADGWIFLAAPTEREWARFSSAIRDRVDVAQDPRFATVEHRRRHDDELAGLLGRLFLEGSARSWEQRLRANDVGCVEVSPGPFEEWLLDPDGGRASGFVTETTHPLIGHHPRLAPLVRLSRSATRAEPGCLVGQHTRSVLSELGYSAERINELAQRGVIRC
jgi:crotonobetainyl-CoA:carnitine CoA-transferase CaiB-like acyl-CoA transferase